MITQLVRQKEREDKMIWVWRTSEKQTDKQMKSQSKSHVDK